MKWWCLIAAKIAGILFLHLVFVHWANQLFPDGRLGRDLNYTFAILAADIFVFVIGYAAWLDQRYRCRVCISRLRMPLNLGDWSHATLIAPPRLEWICSQGHGTLLQEQFQLGGGKPDQWIDNDEDFWRAFDEAWKKAN